MSRAGDTYFRSIAFPELGQYLQGMVRVNEEIPAGGRKVFQGVHPFFAHVKHFCDVAWWRCFTGSSDTNKE
jgi:hypothetical protein